MDFKIDKCSNCPFFCDNEKLSHGIYSTDIYSPSCSLLNVPLVNKWGHDTSGGIDELETTKPNIKCPVFYKSGVNIVKK